MQGDGPLALSLDLRIQQIVREELPDAHRRFRSIGANAMVLDRRHRRAAGHGEPARLRPEPGRQTSSGSSTSTATSPRSTSSGSVFKILTIAAALDTGKVRLKDRFDATGKLVIGRHRIGDDHAKNKLALGARDLRVLVQHRHRADGVRGRRRAAARGLLPPGRLLRQARDRDRRGGPAAHAQALGRRDGGHHLVRPRHRGDAACSSSTRSAAWFGDGTRVPPTLLKREPRQRSRRAPATSPSRPPSCCAG